MCMVFALPFPFRDRMRVSAEHGYNSPQDVSSSAPPDVYYILYSIARKRERTLMMARYRAALVGTGGITQSHLAALQALNDRVELVAAVNPYENLLRAFGQQTGLTRLYTDLGQMLRDEKPD